MYKIEVDQARGVIEVVLGGMMEIAEVADYIADVRAAVIRKGLRSYAMIIDVSECPIQHQDMVRAMGEHMAAMPKARSLAIVTGSSLARMQIRRLFKQPYARIVADWDAGRTWVWHGIEPASETAGAPRSAAA